MLENGEWRAVREDQGGDRARGGCRDFQHGQCHQADHRSTQPEEGRDRQTRTEVSKNHKRKWC